MTNDIRNLDNLLNNISTLFVTDLLFIIIR